MGASLRVSESTARKLWQKKRGAILVFAPAHQYAKRSAHAVEYVYVYKDGKTVRLWERGARVPLYGMEPRAPLFFSGTALAYPRFASGDHTGYIGFMPPDRLFTVGDVRGYDDWRVLFARIVEIRRRAIARMPQTEIDMAVTPVEDFRITDSLWWILVELEGGRNGTN